ncbi:MAG: hypothetical protein ACYDBQ_01410, partial [Thermoplasmatota archaeon]
LRPLEGGVAFAHPTGQRGAPPSAAADRAARDLVEAQVGEPRLLRARRRLTTVRLYRCTCSRGCAREREAIVTAFSRSFGTAAVQEVRCCSRGDPACEFEVRH